MREILFRGKYSKKSPDWIEGSFHRDEDTNICEIAYRYYKKEGETKAGIWVYGVVDPETVGQYTGLKDKNGKKIFEGDIVRTHYANTRKNDFVEQVVFHNGRFCSLYKIPGPGNGKIWASLPDGIPNKTPYMEWCEIIGNVHDNPELLKEEAQP